MTDECDCESCTKECDPASCTNGKCRLTGECIDRLPVVESPPIAAGHDQAAFPFMGRRLVAFTGLAGAGKSTAANHLVRSHGFARVRFAGPLKAMIAALGLSEREIEGDMKEQPCQLLGGKTPRYAMQTLGTEWGRQLIGEHFWIRAWEANVQRLPPDMPVVVDDCRFPNEARAVLAMGGTIARIERQGAGRAVGTHVSESGQSAVPFTVKLRNDRSQAAFRADVSYIFGRVDH